MKKNSDMRKMCVTKPASARNWLGELSTMDQMPGGMPGRKDIAAWKATPSSRAKPRTASSACSRFSGSGLFILFSSNEVAATRGQEEGQGESDDEHGQFTAQHRPESGVPHGRRAPHVLVDAFHRADREHEDAHAHVGDDDDRGRECFGFRVQ